MSLFKNTGALILGAALAVVFGLWGFYFYQRATGYEVDLTKATTATLVAEHAPTAGPKDAKVTIVEFFDPACEACAKFYPIVKSILAENPKDVRLVLRYAPFHQGSEVAVKILEAARAQGLYWQALDVVIARQAEWAAHDNPQARLILTFLPPLGFDLERAKLDMAKPAMDDLLKQDMSDLNALQVTQTPTFYVNGKLLKTFSEAALRELVQQALAATAAPAPAK
ncbi:DsbA family protein [Variovorax sp. HJSM1_2]|uniref:DsbA family protein n=1 Tax=Variovorax sp. HJSM1_2 TaxID=3366263 RepID=UPI003BC3063B